MEAAMPYVEKTYEQSAVYGAYGAEVATPRVVELSQKVSEIVTNSAEVVTPYAEVGMGVTSEAAASLYKNTMDRYGEGKEGKEVKEHGEEGVDSGRRGERRRSRPDVRVHVPPLRFSAADQSAVECLNQIIVPSGGAP